VSRLSFAFDTSHQGHHQHHLQKKKGHKNVEKNINNNQKRVDGPVGSTYAAIALNKGQKTFRIAFHSVMDVQMVRFTIVQLMIAVILSHLTFVPTLSIICVCTMQCTLLKDIEPSWLTW
jgi:hypothetical protein